MIKQKIRVLIKDKNKQNFFIYGVGQVFNLISPFIVAPLVISKCQEAGYGKVGLGFALALFLILIVDYGFDIKGTKLVSENRYEPQILEKILSTTIFTKIVLFALVVLIVAILIAFAPFFYQEKKLFILSLAVVFAQVFNPIWFFQGIENFKMISILNIASKLTYVGLIIVLITQSKDYIFVNFILGCSSFIFNSVGLFYIRKKYHFRISVPTISEIKKILKDDFSICISQLFLSVKQLSPLAMVSYFLGFTIAGQYRVIEQIINLFRTFSQVFLKFFYAQACYKFMINRAQGWSYWKKYTILNIAIVTFSVLILSIFSAEILRFFHLSEDTILQLDFMFKVALSISFLMAITLPLEQMMFIQDKAKTYLKITIFVTALNIVLLLVLIKPFELFGIISTLIISEILFIAFYFYNVFSKTKQVIKNENHFS